MKTTLMKQAIAGAALAMAASAASAQTVTLDLNYLATNGYGYTSNVGTITLTDLADLGLGDGFTGVRSTVSLTNLNQFSSGTGAVWISSYELNFADTELLTNASFRNVSGLATTGIEFEENGCFGTGANCGTPQAGWGGAVGDPAWGQEINFATSAFTQGNTSTIDFLNGEGGYNGFTVAALLANAVENNADPTQPDGLAWIRIRGNTAANGGGVAANGYWGNSISSGSGTGQNYRLNVMAVPEPETYAMMLAGLGFMGFVARRRRSV